MTQPVHPVPAVEAVRWSPDGVPLVIDQRRLPAELVELELRSAADVAEAIRTGAARGGPLIGIMAAMAVAQAAAADAVARTEATGADIAAALRAEADAIHAEVRAMCLAIGEHGAALLHHGMRILTHGNAGALATGGIGTALAPVYMAHARGVVLRVFADETRPRLEGARLTAWELTRAGVPVTLLADGAAASLMASGHVDLVIVGADRIAANGDVASTTGTYGLAVLAQHHRIPFIVAAPRATIDPHTATGAEVPIGQRDADEVLSFGGTRVGADGVAVHNPAFDVTPAALVTHYITERGIEHAPFRFDVSCVEIPPPA